MRTRFDNAAIVLTVVAVIRIVSTYTTFSATYDEPMYLCAGLELITMHQYTLQPENPPLPRIVLAFPAFVGGVHYSPAIPPWDQVKSILYLNDRYRTNLVL